MWFRLCLLFSCAALQQGAQHEHEHKLTVEDREALRVLFDTLPKLRSSVGRWGSQFCSAGDRFFGVVGAFLVGWLQLGLCPCFLLPCPRAAVCGMSALACAREFIVHT